MDEFELIAWYFAPLAGAGGFGLTDDVAVIPPQPGKDLVVTTDAIMAGVDFLPGDPPDTIAKKALRVNLSDLAAKGAAPAWYLLNLMLPRSVTPQWLEAFAAGLAADQKQFGVSLLGGDTGATDGAAAISITAFGHVPEGTLVRRGGARPGDAVYVTGSIGDSGGGLAVLKGEKHQLGDADRDALVARYRVPEPPVSFGATALRGIATAAIDVSDGLIADLGHLAQGSGVGIAVEGERVPRSPALLALWGEGTAALLRAVAAGDDYQIAFTAGPGLSGPFTRIGTVAAGKGVRLLVKGEEVAISQPGYRHF